MKFEAATDFSRLFGPKEYKHDDNEYIWILEWWFK